jgi:carbamoyl-phosphate synthase large subunit
VFDDDQLRHYMKIALGASDMPDQPILVDKFLSEAIECDVDVIGDYETNDGRKNRRGFRAGAPDDKDRRVSQALVCGVMEHIEEAGIHSGDSACAIPPYSLPEGVIKKLKDQSRRLAEALRVRGLMNVQYAIRRPDAATGTDFEIYVLEVNPRASRTVPFVSKATGVPWARLAAKAMIGMSLAELGVTREVTPRHTSVKESVFPFGKFPGVDVILGPEMRSTGEVMGIDRSFPIAFAKSQMAAGTMLPVSGKVFLSVRKSDKAHVVDVARKLLEMGFSVVTTAGTHDYLLAQGIVTQRVRKISEGRPNAVDMIKNHELALLINTPSRKGLDTDEGRLRSTAVRFSLPMITTTTGAAAAVQAIAALQAGKWGVQTLQEYF